ncbi:MAG: hypothetical protein ACYST5_12725 [Planctomycetota bacterium]|jgi:hypothetical protein
MISPFSKTIWLVFVMAFIIGGCEQKYKEDVEVLALGPALETLDVVPDYAAGATEAAGGPDAWMKTKELQLDCVVTFYQADGSFYLTEQHYEVYPWSNSIRISGREPPVMAQPSRDRQGKFVCQFSKGLFSVLHGGDRIEGLPSAVESRCFAEVILNVITVPARFLDESVEFTKVPDPIKLQGQWYYPISRRMKPRRMAETTFLEAFPDLSAAVFYQNRDNFLVDMLWFPQMDGGKSLTVRGYDYSEIEKGGVLVPARIEIFRTDARGDSQERLVKIDCHTLGRTK